VQFPIIIGLHRSRILDGGLFLLVGLASATLLACTLQSYPAERRL
jgi:hypothetical protein